MKNFFKTVLATIVGLLAFSLLSSIMFFSTLGTLASLGETKPIVPSSAVLTIDMSKIVLAEQTMEPDALAILQNSGNEIQTIGIYNAIKAIEAAACDPSINYIYLKPDAVIGGMAQIEEFRIALQNFRMSGKAVISYIENPTNAGFYLASVSDRIYMTPYDGGMNMFTGVSSQMVFLKDLLENLGINVQLIRHGKYKSAGEMFINSSPSADNLEQNEAMIASIWNNWSGAIADSRGISTEELNSLLENLELCFAEDFLSYGLVDGLTSREEMREKLALLYGAETADQIQTISLPDYAAAKAPEVSLKSKSKVAVIYFEGEIIDGNGLEQVAGDRFAKIIADVRNDENVKAAVLRVNSPGGSVLAAEKILAEIKLLQEKMPVVASYGDYAASGGYWISAGCDKIYSNAGTLTGSIGVFSMIPDFSKTLENKLHVNITSVNSNKHADMYGMMRPLDEAEIRYMQKSVEKIYSRFTNIVSEGRELSVERVDEIAQGRVWTGSEAVEIGLVDEIGTIEDAVDWALASIEDYTDISKVEIAQYPRPLTTLELLIGQLEGGENNILTGTPFESVGEAFGNWSTSESGKVYARIPYHITIK